MPQVRLRVERQILMSRAEIDHLDAMLIPILSRRIATSHAVIAEKRAAGLPVLDAAREEQILVKAPAGPARDAMAAILRICRESA